MASQVASDFEGQVALVTGGSSGIGLATAQAFLQRGAAVAICGRSATRGQQAVEVLSAFGEVEFFTADVTGGSDVARMIGAVMSRFGRLDHAFNNAANTEAATGAGGFSAMELAEFEGIVRASLTSVWLCMKYELPVLLADGGGSIVNTSSMDAQLRMAGTGSYAAAKSGVEALTVSAAKEFAAQGVRINAIRPGAIRTPMLENNLRSAPGDRREHEDRYRSMIAMRRIGEPSEIADVVLWLCSPRSSYVTGQVITVDGSLGL